jgi:hypothetical protein
MNNWIGLLLFAALIAAIIGVAQLIHNLGIKDYEE